MRLRPCPTTFLVVPMTVASEIEALRGEMREGNARLEGKLDAYIAAHTATHAASEVARDDARLPLRVRDLEDWRLRETAAREAQVRLIKATLGTSVLSVILAMAGLLYYLTAIAHAVRL